MEVKRVSVIGAGTMGSGIAQVAAESGFEVSIIDAAPGLGERGYRAIEKNLMRAVEKGKTTSDAAAATIQRLHVAPDMAEAAKADLIIEAVTMQSRWPSMSQQGWVRPLSR